MIKRLFYILVAFLAVASMAAKHVAVLETISEKDIIGRSEKIFLTDKLRERAKAVLPAYMGYVVMTRENINVMLPPGKSIEDCEGSCLVETGKNIAADYVAQARVGKFGKQLTLTMELYETAGNNLVGSFTTRKPDAEGLLEEIERESDDFFRKILGENPANFKGDAVNRNVEESSRPGSAIIDLTQDAVNRNVEESSRSSSKNVNVEKSVLKDSRDGKEYRTVKIGEQVWMAENLKYKINDSYCYEDKESNCNKYGRHYEWNAAYKACPSGWKLPSKADFETLLETIGGVATAGKKLKAKNGWQKKNGTDEYAFSVLPAGMRFIGDYPIAYDGNEAYFWTTTSHKYNNAFMVGLKLNSEGDEAVLNKFDRFYGFSVRCIKE